MSHPCCDTQWLAIDTRAEVRRVVRFIEDAVHRRLRRRGLVVRLTGGVESAVVAALSTLSLGREHVTGLLATDRDVPPEALDRSRVLARSLGLPLEIVSIEPLVEATGCRRETTAAIRSVLPEYDERWRSKIVVPALGKGPRLAVFSIEAESPRGEAKSARLTPEALRRLVAAANMKRRVRAQVENYYADRLLYAVAGATSRIEYDQGLFAKHGDGAADIKPLAHLYKTQIDALAEHLEVPLAIRSRAANHTDSDSLDGSEQAYGALPHAVMDVCLWGKNHGMDAAEVARAAGVEPQTVEALYWEIDQRRRSTRYRHERPLVLEEIGEIRTFVAHRANGPSPPRGF
jgi:NAD+ synthase